MTEDNNDLASRGSRLVAVIIDGIIAVPILIVIAKVTGFWDRIIPRLASGTQLTFEEITIIFCVGQCLFLILNGYFLSKDGQTIGKRIIGIKIVSIQRENVGLMKIYFLRYLITSIISQIPVIRSFFNLINILFIFGKERRCLHDRIAGTVVVKNK
jgi:uncharacterized RDD family membrane protein YckC